MKRDLETPAHELAMVCLNDDEIKHLKELLHGENRNTEEILELIDSIAFEYIAFYDAFYTALKKQAKPYHSSSTK